MSAITPGKLRCHARFCHKNTVGIRKPTIQKPESFENQTFWWLVFEWFRFQMVEGIAVAMVPNI